jgi:hypothetical protein
MIRIVALDHFATQDWDALAAASGDRFRWRVFPYWRLRNGANRIFPAEVQEGLEPYEREELAPQRTEFKSWLRSELARIFIEWPFDVVVLPSDSFYYVRPLPELAHELGAPVVVVQKETTITEETLRVHAPDVQAYAPFVSDRMTVCSERHKRFWVASGADPATIDVTGQPRFDLYTSGRETGLPDRQSRSLLFLSYDRTAYLHDAADRAEGWSELHDQTEAVLLEAKRAGWQVLVKLHPQQDWDEERRLLDPRIKIAPRDADTRRLILAADAVVGFQTTALYEAMAAGKPIAYTAWTALYERVASQLIPFEDRPDLLDVIRSPEELAAWLRDPPPPSPDAAARRREFVEEMLGPFDGRACERTLAILETTAAEWEDARARSQRRGDLERRVFPAAMLSTPTSLALAATWTTVEAFARAAPHPRLERVRRGSALRRRVAWERLALAFAALRAAVSPSRPA